MYEKMNMSHYIEARHMLNCISRKIYKNTDNYKKKYKKKNERRTKYPDFCQKVILFFFPILVTVHLRMVNL